MRRQWGTCLTTVHTLTHMHRCEQIYVNIFHKWCINTKADGLVTQEHINTHTHTHTYTHTHTHTADNRNREGQETEYKLFPSSMTHPFDISPWKKCLSNHSFGWPTSELLINFLWGSLAHPTPYNICPHFRDDWKTWRDGGGEAGGKTGGGDNSFLI